MKFIQLISVLLLYNLHVFAQSETKHSFLSNSDTLDKKRFKLVAIGQGGIWAGSLLVLNQAWYSDYPRSGFHLFNDIGEWQQVDKVGHAYSAYWLAQSSTSLFRWSGVDRKRAAWYGAGMGIAYESVIEILDGFSAEWGFSLGDMAANLSGSTLYAGQEIAWQEQRIQMKFSTHRVDYNAVELLKKANQLYGQSNLERFFKDYNGQTYWLSANIWSFAKKSKFPKWLNIAVGYGADGMLGGYDNIWEDENGQMHNRSDVKRIRQFYVSPDIDLSKITIRGKTPKALKLLNGLKIKFPLPTLEYNTAGQLKMHAFYL
jgi:hypothetical protein